METRDVILIASLVLGGTGLVGVVVAIIRVPREAGQIIVKSAQVVVEIAQEQLDNLREENVELRERDRQREQELHELRERLEELERTSASPDDLLSLQARNDQLETELATVRSEKDALQLRVDELEAEVRILKGGDR